MTDEEAEARWNKLDKDVQAVYTLEKLKETNKYNSSVYTVEFVKACYGMAFDVYFMAQLYPAAIWHGLEQAFAFFGLCNGGAGASFEILVVGITFSLTCLSIELILFSGIDFIAKFVVEKTYGF